MAAKDFVWGNPRPEQEPNKYKWLKLPLEGKHMSNKITRESLKRLVQEELSKYAEGCAPMYDPGDEHSREGSMARSNLFKAAKYADELMSMFSDETDLPEWVESKITRASDYLSMVKHYLEGEIARSQGVLQEEDVYFHIEDASSDDGKLLDEDLEFWDDVLEEAEYQGRKVTLNKPTRGDVKKFKVYVKDPKTGNGKKVNFGDPNMRIKKSNPKRRKSFRARHNCDNPGPKTKARYWSCKKW